MVRLIEVFNSQTHVYMAMEAVHGRELFEEVTEHGRMTESRARDLFVQVHACAVCFTKSVRHVFSAYFSNI